MSQSPTVTVAIALLALGDCLRIGVKSRVLRSVRSERGGPIAGPQARLSLAKRRQSGCRSPWLRALRAARVAVAVRAGRTAPGPHSAGRSATAERHATFETSSRGEVVL